MLGVRYGYHAGFPVRAPRAACQTGCHQWVKSSNLWLIGCIWNFICLSFSNNRILLLLIKCLCILKWIYISKAVVISIIYFSLFNNCVYLFGISCTSFTVFVRSSIIWTHLTKYLWKPRKFFLCSLLSFTIILVFFNFLWYVLIECRGLSLLFIWCCICVGKGKVV